MIGAFIAPDTMSYKERMLNMIINLKEYRSEEEILFSAAMARIHDGSTHTCAGTCFAGMGKVCSKSLTPNPQRANHLRTQDYW